MTTVLTTKWRRNTSNSHSDASCVTDDEHVEREREEEILGDERNDGRCGRQDLCHEQLKEVESEKNGHAQRHFLARCCREAEDNADQDAHQACGNDQVHGVVERFAAHLNQEDHFDVIGR